MSPLIIGITGGIGSGKSYVCKLLAQQGYALYEADARAKAVVVEDEEVKRNITALLGQDAYLADGTYNRAFVAQQVFHDSEKLAALNALVHPAMKDDFNRFLQRLPKHYPKKAVIKEAAIMYESGSHKATDVMVTVYAPMWLRLQRVQQRDGISVEAVLARMEKQWTDSQKIRLADYTLYNDGFHAVAPQLSWLLQRLGV